MADSDVAAHIRAVAAETIAAIDAADGVRRTTLEGPTAGVAERSPGTENQVAGSPSRRLLRRAGWWA